MRLLSLGLLGLAACGEPDRDCVPVPSACPADAPVLGEAGEFVVDSAALTWTYERKCRFHRSQPIYVQVPPDTLSLAVSVDVQSRDTAVGFARNDDEVLLDVSLYEGEGAFYHGPWYHGFSPVSTWLRPMRPDDSPQEGCLSLVALTFGKEAVEGGRIAFSTKRGEPGDGIDVVVGLVEGTQIDDADLRAGIDRMAEVLAGVGIAVDSAEIVDVPSDVGPIIKQSGEDLNALRAADFGGAEHDMVLLVVQDFEEQDGTLGFAAGIPGPLGLPGTAASAVVLSVDAHLDSDFETFLSETFGETAAHELGHQMGLFHTTESEGTEHDFLDDTPACNVEERDMDGDGEVTAEECDGFGGRNVMFWSSADFPQTEWSADQGFVMTRSPVAK